MTTKSILLLAGEASGDYHAAALVRDLKELVPDVRISGIGGDRLAQAGMEVLRHYREINTIALGEGLRQVRNILSAYRVMKNELRSGKHQLFIPVDYPDVNLRLCRIARKAGTPVCYYVSPQVWAWRKGRIRTIARRVDKMMTLFPFEERLYREAGVESVFVGHTMVKDIPENWDRTSLRRELQLNEDSYVVALVPGSRPAEIGRMLPRMSRAAELFARKFPDASFVLPLAAEHLKPLVQSILADYPIEVRVHSVEAPRIMAAADSGLVTSGTATLQAALCGMPHAVVYVVDPITWWFGLKVIHPLLMEKDVHLAIANVLSIQEETFGPGPIAEMQAHGISITCQECGRALFVPEALQDRAAPENLAEWLTRFRLDQNLTQTMKSGFRRIRRMLEPPGQGPIAAKIVAEMLRK
ncbi:MAG: lipid-A-disaccharide synthase [Deltaproteobacteria bacterium]|nr:lipid-A-disaccharide synthase [Deltaproteobacteria bacterium]